jgi:hypothetical protein
MPWASVYRYSVAEILLNFERRFTRKWPHFLFHFPFGFGSLAAMRNSRLLFALFLVIVGFGSGCATPALWGIKDCSPAPQPHLAMAFASDKYDFLVTYAEKRGSTGKQVQTNSYWLFEYADNRPKNHRPTFVHDPDLAKLTPLPILMPKEALPETGYSARYFISEGSTTFDLYHEGVDIGRFTLPNYSTGAQPANFTRVVLTPPAVIADTAIISCLVGIFAFAYSNGSIPSF